MVLGRPKCILDTIRVERRPEKAETRSDLAGGQRDENDDGTGPAAEAGLGTVRGGKGRGFERETWWVVGHWLVGRVWR